MSDLLSPAAPISAALQSPGNTPPPPPRHGVRCPRCGSNNTKFCYYNNYSTAQPRHYCKSCRRYWTEGGSLRNIPIGGATSCRKNKRPRVSSPGETSDDGGGGGVFMIPQAPPPPVDHFQLAGNLYPPNLSPFGDHLLFRAPPPLPSGSPLDLLEGLNFNSPLINNSAVGGGGGGGGLIEYSLINYSLNHQQQQHRMDLLYGGVSGGGEIAQMNTILNNKDKNYQNEEEDIKNVRVVGPTDDVMNLFGNSSTKTQPKYEYSHSHDQSVAGNYEDHESPAASASNRWLFTGASSSNSAINGNKNNINNNNHERSDGNATSSSLKRWMSW